MVKENVLFEYTGLRAVIDGKSYDALDVTLRDVCLKESTSAMDLPEPMVAYDSLLAKGMDYLDDKLPRLSDDKIEYFDLDNLVIEVPN